MMKLNVIDLFSGVGGFSLGFKMNGFDIVLANEIDKDIAQSYMKNHPETLMINEDIKNINIDNTFAKYKNSIDVIIGGPPCQGFSQKGQRKSINDERNFLFKQFYKIVEFIKPKYFVMENVPNLLTIENGYFKNEIEDLFGTLGYSINAEILNASDYGVPQNRKRAVILGKLGCEKLDLPIHLNTRITIWDAISDLAYLESGEGEYKQVYKYEPQSNYQELLRFKSLYLYNHIATKHSDLTLERLKLIPPNKGREVLPKEHLTKSIFSGTWSRMIQDDVSVTITTRFDTPSSGKFTHPFLHRALTVREAARIQSFPDNFIFYGSKNSQMKQVGNAVPPLLSKEIAKVIKIDALRNNYSTE